MDGTDCPIAEPQPFCSDWYSHKINGPGLRYEIALSIYESKLVWVSGPFPAGKYTDLVIFRRNLKNQLDEHECVISDEIYKDYKCVRRGNLVDEDDNSVHSNIRARHENLNEVIKNFNVLKTRFRHHQSLHSFCFHAVLRISQFIIEHENPLTDLVYLFSSSVLHTNNFKLLKEL